MYITRRNFTYNADNLMPFSNSTGHAARLMPPKFERDMMKHDRVGHIFVKKTDTCSACFMASRFSQTWNVKEIPKLRDNVFSLRVINIMPKTSSNNTLGMRNLILEVVSGEAAQSGVAQQFYEQSNTTTRADHKKKMNDQSTETATNVDSKREVSPKKTVVFLNKFMQSSTMFHCVELKFG